MHTPHAPRPTNPDGSPRRPPAPSCPFRQVLKRRLGMRPPWVPSRAEFRRGRTSPDIGKENSEGVAAVRSENPPDACQRRLGTGCAPIPPVSAAIQSIGLADVEFDGPALRLAPPGAPQSSNRDAPPAEASTDRDGRWVRPPCPAHGVAQTPCARWPVDRFGCPAWPVLL